MKDERLFAHFQHPREAALAAIMDAMIAAGVVRHEQEGDLHRIYIPEAGQKLRDDPTDEMIEAGRQSIPFEAHPSLIRNIYRAMAHAALREQGEG